jgi:hypothetical protein
LITLDDIEEIRQLKARYCRCVDLKLWSGLRALFTDDCVFVTATSSSNPDQFVANAAKALGKLTTAHHVTNPEIREAGGDRAIGNWAFQDFITWHPEEDDVPRFLRGTTRQKGFLGFGFYQEEYEKTAKGWKIAKMRITRLVTVPLLDIPPVLAENEALDAAYASPDPEWIPVGDYKRSPLT